MKGAPTPPDGDGNAPKLRFKEQTEDDTESRGDGTIPLEGRLNVSPDEEPGGDPYNHTGRFERNIR